jgi:2-(1,2-epoxy-1,2-dihydrophenyl)acetyl-CoA isomerase
MAEKILFEQRDGVAEITFNRPDAANALDLETSREFMEIAIRCDEDPSVRAVVLTGRGKMFSAGGDLGSFAKAGDQIAALLKEMTTYLHAAISRLARMRAPLIGAINGTAAGAGFSLVCSTDLAIAAESAKFTMAYTKAGLTPDGSSTYFMPRLLGTHRTLELMLTNRVLSAAEAAEWGLINRVVPDDQVLPEARALATQLAAGPTEAIGGVKKMVIGSLQESLETQMELEARTIAAMAHTADAKEGIDAFFAKRQAKFEGR